VFLIGGKPTDFVNLGSFKASVDLVTVGDMREFSKQTGRELHDYFYDVSIGPLCPAVYVSADDADAFCKWADVRLPTSDEWNKIRASGGVRLSGLYEWTRDTTTDGARVLRGGSWYDVLTDYFRCAYRFIIDPTYRSVNLGFRVIKV